MVFKILLMYIKEAFYPGMVIDTSHLSIRGPKADSRIVGGQPGSATLSENKNNFKN